jgi:hypothetical protein
MAGVGIGYVGLLALALTVILVFLDGIWMVGALIVVALGASVLPELVMDLRYSRYQDEWESRIAQEPAEPSSTKRRSDRDWDGSTMQRSLVSVEGRWM